MPSSLTGTVRLCALQCKIQGCLHVGSWELFPYSRVCHSSVNWQGLSPIRPATMANGAEPHFVSTQLHEAYSQPQVTQTHAEPGQNQPATNMIPLRLLSRWSSCYLTHSTSLQRLHNAFGALFCLSAIVALVHVLP